MDERTVHFIRSATVERQDGPADDGPVFQGLFLCGLPVHDVPVFRGAVSREEQILVMEEHVGGVEQP